MHLLFCSPENPPGPQGKGVVGRPRVWPVTLVDAVIPGRPEEAVLEDVMDLSVTQKTHSFGKKTPDVCEGKQNEVGRTECIKGTDFFTQMFVVGVWSTKETNNEL